MNFGTFDSFVNSEVTSYEKLSARLDSTFYNPEHL